MRDGLFPHWTWPRSSRMHPCARDGVTRIVVENARKAMAKVAAAFHGHPARRMPVIGITGTNGKTTVSWMLESILTVANVACGVMGTTGHRIGGQAIEAKHTTRINGHPSLACQDAK